MKNIYVILLLISIYFNTSSQNSDNDLNAISLSVIMPDNIDGLSQSALSKIESKIQHIVTRYGISGQGFTNDFVIYPKFEIYEDNIIEGMRNIHSVEGEFNLFIKQLKTGKVFSSYNKSIKGSGLSKERAINNAISNISVNDPKLKDFITQAKNKIINYYNNNCNMIAGDAKSFIKQHKYFQAIALLYTVPKEAKKCYQQIQSLSDKAYQAYQTQKCQENLMEAKSRLANNDYSGALYSLKFIDPTSKCAPEAKRLINVTAAKVDAKERKEWNFMLKRYNDRLKMQKYRLQIQKEIAKAYYGSKPKQVIYKSLF